MSFGDRVRNVVNTFLANEKDQIATASTSYGAAYTVRPDKSRPYISNDRSMITAVLVRIAIDVSSVLIKHVRLDEEGRFSEEIKSGLNNCLNVEANLDQGGRAFRQDAVMSLCERGVIALVPVDTTLNPKVTDSYDILTMRVGEIVQWYPRHVRVSVYNVDKGIRQEITLPKRVVAIAENPLYAVMNEPNSTLQRLLRKLTLLDMVDEASASGKLDLIIQLPYVIKTEARRQQALQRREDIEFQLKGSKYGIAYTDGTEKITQLNRPAENNLLAQVTFLMEHLYSQLGITAEIMNGTADEKAMLNYWNRTIEPIADALVESMKRTFLTKTARTQGQSIEYFRDAFRLVAVENIADIVDKLARNEVLSSNEFRQILGFRPSKDPKADQLVNSNMPQIEAAPPVADLPADTPTDTADSTDVSQSDDAFNNGLLDSLDVQLTAIFEELGVDEEGNATSG